MSYVFTKGSVEDIKDPAKAGRIKVKMPEMDDGIYPEWINPILPGLWFTIPNVGDSVLIIRPDDDDIVEFADDIFYFGRFLDQDHPAEEEHRENYPNRHGFKTKQGHTIIIDDTGPASFEITIAYRGFMLFSMTEKGMFFGTQDANEPMVLGTAWKTMMSTLLDALITHKHPTGTGPSGPPLPPEGGTLGTNTWQKLKDELDNQLSDFIFAQKAKPTKKTN